MSLGSFLLSSGFLPDGMMNPTSVAATYGAIEAKYEYDQYQPPVPLITASESSSFSGSSFSSGSSTSPPASSSSIAYQPLTAAAMGLSSTITLSPPQIDEDMSSPSLSPPSDTSQSTPPPKKTNHGGRKRSIIFEQAEAESQRKEFLERNRIAGKIEKSRSISFFFLEGDDVFQTPMTHFKLKFCSSASFQMSTKEEEVDEGS